jgi:hypothetical protein
MYAPAGFTTDGRVMPSSWSLSVGDDMLVIP